MSKEKNILKNKAKKLPNTPGVYLFLDKKEKPLYIGKAGSLKKRVSSYFTGKKHERTQELIKEAADIDYRETDTVLEALVLEANLIKKYRPEFNVRDKDNRSFVYLVISKKDDFPKPIIVRGRQLKKYVPTGQHSRFDFRSGDFYVFGPYQSYRLLKTALKIIRKVFPYCTKGPSSSENPRPCFHYQINQCPGVCIGKISSKEYKKNIRNLRDFFAGDKKRLIKRLKKENPEKARALKHVHDVALLSGSNVLSSNLARHGIQRIEGYDISHLGGKEPVGGMVVFENGEKDVSQYRLFKIRNKKDNKNYSDTDMLQEVLTRRLKHKEWPYPDIIFVDGGRAQGNAIKNVLKEHKMELPVVCISKAGKHSGSSSKTNKLYVSGAKKNIRELIVQNRKLFQRVRDEAHRFAINFQKKRRRNKK